MFSLFTRLGAQQVSPDTAYQQKLIEFQQLLQSGQVNEGAEFLDNLIKEYPDYSEAYYAKSLLYAQLGDLETSLPLAKEAIRLKPKDLTYNNHLLGLYKSMGDGESIVRTLNELLQYYPNNPVILREKILMLHASNQSEQALAVYDEAIQTIGDSDTLDVVKAEVLIDMGKLKEARTLLEKWYRQRSPIREVYGTLGFLHNNLGQPKQAVQVIEDGLASTKNDYLYFDLADVYNNQKKPERAYMALQQAFRSESIPYPEKHRVMAQIAASPDMLSLPQKQDLANLLVLKYPRIAENYNFKADILWQGQNLAEAKSLYLTSLGINPRQADTWRKLINVELAANQLSESILHGQEALIHFPDNAILFYFTGVAYFLNNDTTEAREYLEAALDNSENENDYVKSMIYGSLGDLYHSLNMVKVSDAAYQEAISLDSTNSSALNNLAYYWSLRKQNLDQAAEYARQATELDPASTTFMDTYAWVLFQQGEYQQAQTWMEKAMRGEKPSAVMLEHYGDILSKQGKTKNAITQWQKALNLVNGDKSVDVDKLKEKIREKKFIE
ncbi:tetratricopeptide repeat protein [Sphingobacterium sp. lm-10]|uniref:tetratricopeptide repeat protein n=1 Tax=Sphingobacterium sp. lm-10 TaxID=2944904 RepID=UPI00201FDB22|nr:tetratricopeptide repeat protein [Sphingobacterium sp. lm-10]